MEMALATMQILMTMGTVLKMPLMRSRWTPLRLSTLMAMVLVITETSSQMMLRRPLILTAIALVIMRMRFLMTHQKRSIPTVME